MKTQDETETVEGASASSRRRRVALFTVVAFAASALVALHFYEIGSDPPGFFADESSIAYNAYVFARDGADEHGARRPLFFRAFGEYKSPAYIYLLAALYELTGPSIAVARALSAALGLAAAFVLGLVSMRASKRDEAETSIYGGAKNFKSGEKKHDGRKTYARVAGLCVALTALLTPWLFEVGRLAFEVALMPLALALLLLALQKAHARGEWTWADSLRVAAALALVTYAYSAGRLLAPLLALGLVLFARRDAWTRALALTWLLYAAALAPIFIFDARNPGALAERFAHVSFIRPEMSWTEIALRFLKNYASAFNPYAWLVAGDPEPRHHVQTMGSLLSATVAATLIGLSILIIRRRVRDAFMRFVLYGLVIAPIPSALTQADASSPLHFHTLRLIALPVFLLPLAGEGFVWLLKGGRARRSVFVALAFLTLSQGALFRRQFHYSSQKRLRSFDAHYPSVFDAAMRRPERPIHILDNPGAPGYIHAFWYATLRGEDASLFVRLPSDAKPPAGALVISTEKPCAPCRVISEGGPFRAYIAE